MNRKFKALGLAFVAVLAMSAVLASAAQATNGQFTAAGYPTTLKGEQENATNYFEATPGNKTECKTATYQATLTGPSGQLTVTPHYNECEAGGIHTTITLNGCHFLFKTSGTTVNGDTPGTADVVCPTGKVIEINVGGICKVDIGAQAGLTGVTFTNGAADNVVTVDVDITNQIKYTDTDSTFFCPFAGTASFANGSFVSQVKMEGFVDPGGTTTGPTGAGTTYNKGAARNIDVG